MKMKKILALALALLALAAAFGGCTVKKAESGGKEETEKTSGGAAADAGDEDENAPFSFAADGFVLERDAEYSYSYDEAGLCTEARDAESGETVYTFDYKYDGEGRPVERYVEEDGERRLLEEYEYDKKGNLVRLSVYDEDGEPVSVWEYDSKGRAVAGKGISPQPPVGVPGFYGPDLEDIEWDEQDRLTSVIIPVDYPREMLVGRIAGQAAQADIEARQAQIDEFIKSYKIKENDDGTYRTEFVKETFVYDKQGRVTRFVYMHEYTPLGNFLMTARPDASRREDTLKFRYSDDEMLISYSARVWNAGTGKWEDGGLDGDVSYQIERSADGLPLLVKGLSTDVYGALDCEVKSAEVGLFGVSWSKEFTEYLGEVHGGFAGLDPRSLSAYLSSGGLQSLRVEGEGPDGEKLVYLMWPDQFGRQRCQKLTDGRLTMNVSSEMDVNRAMTYVMEDDSDEYVYREPAD